MPQKYLVPQYIEIEPKMFGPVTVRQFVLLLYAGLVGFIIWKIFGSTRQTMALIIILFHTLLWLMIAFTKINGQNFHYFMLNIFRTFKKPRLRVWRKAMVKAFEKEEPLEEGRKIPTKKLPPMARLSDISLMVDTGGAYNVDAKKQKQPEAKAVEEINI